MCEKSVVNDQRLRFLVSGIFTKVWMARRDAVEAGMNDLSIVIDEERKRIDAEGRPSKEGTAIADWLEANKEGIRSEMRKVAKHDIKHPTSSGVEKIMGLRRVQLYDTTHPHCACSNKAA